MWRRWRARPVAGENRGCGSEIENPYDGRPRASEPRKRERFDFRQTRVRDFASVFGSVRCTSERARAAQRRVEARGRGPLRALGASMASTAPRAKAEAAGAAPTVEAARADDAARVATADLQSERQKRLPSPWTPELPLSSAAALAATDAVRDDDVALDPEEASTQRAARVLRATAELCGAPPSVSIAALVYLVVFYARPEHAHASDAWADVVPACLLLASKIEEKPTRVSDVVNAMQRVMHPLRRDPAFLRTEAANGFSPTEKKAANGDDWTSRARDAATEKTSATEKRPTFVKSACVVSNGNASNVEPVGPNAPERSGRGRKTEDPRRRDPAVSRFESEFKKKQSPAATRDAFDAAAKSKFLHETIARLKKKYPALLPKSLYASAVARWEAKTRPDPDPRSDAEGSSVGKKRKRNVARRDARAEIVAPPPRTFVVTSSRDGTTVVQVKASGSSERRRTTTSPKTNPHLRDEDDPNFRLSRPVVGDAYYDRKARVLRAEQKVLRAVDAEVNVPKIVSVFLNVARVVRAPKAVTKLALVVLTDTLYATASPSRLALGLFFGAPREEVSETTAVGDDGTQQKKQKTAVLAARAPSSSPATRPRRLCVSPRASAGTRFAVTTQGARRGGRAWKSSRAGREETKTHVSGCRFVGDSDGDADGRRTFERGRGPRSRSVVGGDGVRPRARRAHRAGRAGRADARRAPRRRVWSVGGENVLG